MNIPDKLNPDFIETDLSTKRVGKQIVIFQSTSSTNDIAAQYARNVTNDGLVVLAEEQTKGRGRGGHQWLSPPSESILCSILIFEDNQISEILSLTSAVAVAKAIGTVDMEPAHIKWPNDILVGNNKIGGILLETKAGKEKTAYIVGVGINCHQKQFSNDLNYPATSIDMETNSVCDRNRLIKRLLISFDEWLTKTLSDEETIVEQWKQLSTLLNRRITLTYERKLFEGSCIGIDPGKGLILQLDKGGVRIFEASKTTNIKYLL